MNWIGKMNLKFIFILNLIFKKLYFPKSLLFIFFQEIYKFYKKISLYIYEIYLLIFLLNNI